MAQGKMHVCALFQRGTCVGSGVANFLSHFFFSRGE